MNIIKDIKQIKFYLKTTEEIKKTSVCEITEIDLYEKNNEPKKGSLMDPRLGPNDKDILCQTCKNDINICPGHFGYIQMAVPIYNILYINYVKKILEVTCCYCSNLLIDYNDLAKINLIKSKLKGQRFKIIQSINKNNKIKICYNCSRIQPKYVKTGISLQQVFTIEENSKQKELKKNISAGMTLMIFKNMKDQDIDLLGLSNIFSRPESLIIEVLPVPPPCIRPSVKYSTNMRSEDDLIYKYVDILKANHNLLEKIKKNNDNHIEDYIEYLQYHVATLIDNNIKGVPQAQHRSGRPLKCLKDRIKGKEARIRGNLLGKRVNFSARTVVGPDPSLSIHELGIPYIICKKITIPEAVNIYNIEKLQKCIRNGPEKYPGANFLKKKKNNDKITLDLRFVKYDIQLNEGDIVERHLMENDYILFNRQPSLHKMSMMGHKVKPIIGKSFRLNPAVCQPYNADFDGDEMNIFVPQSFQTMLELKEIACVTEQIISPQSNSPVIGCIMDVVVGAMKLTLPDTYLDEETVYHILSKIDNFDGNIPEPFIIDNKKYWHGREIINLILPDINYFKKNDDENIDIVNGKIISGIFNKSVVGSSSGSLVHMITNDLNEGETKKFLNTIQRIINSWLKFEGFSVGFGDTLIENKIKNKIKDIITTSKGKVNNFINMIYDKNIKITQGDFERKIFNILNEARDQSGSIVMKNINKNNYLYQMVHSKSKGNSINISQIISCVGQQNVQFKGSSGRIPFSSNNRTLPYYYQYDNRPEAKGFVENSYLDGLNINEFFFHAQSGREGLIDTACKTAETGYIQRRLMKSLEDLNVKYDLTVRNEKGVVVQFCYGCDNFDPKKVEKQKFELILGSNKDFEKKYKWDENKLKEYDENIQNIINKEFKQLVSLRKYFRNLKYHNDDIVYLPINIYRIVKQSRKKFSLKYNEKYNLTPEYIIEQIKDLNKNVIKLNCDLSYPYNELNEYNLKLLRTLVKSKLSTKILLFENNLSKDAFDWIINNIKITFYKSLVQPGESVGSIAAQSLGEPTTQLTLNSIDYNEKIVLRHNKLKYMVVKIGDFIEKIDKTYNKKLKKYFKLGDQTYIDVNKNNENYEIYAVDWDGNYKWCELQAVTKHLPLVDGKRDNLIKITLESGREVTGTKAKSFLRFNEKLNKLEQCGGKDIQIGDYVPIMKKLNIPKNQQLNTLNIEEYFPKNKYLYGDECLKTFKWKNTEILNDKCNQKRHWFKRFNGDKFIIPYNRGDSFIDGMKMRCKNNEMPKLGYIYCKKSTSNKYPLKLPQFFKLDELFGFFIGAFLAEGLANKNQVKISNNDIDFRNKIYDFCDKYEIGYYTTKRVFGDKNSNIIKTYTYRNRNENDNCETTTYTEYIKTKNYRNGISTDITIYNTMLSELLKKLCNTGSKNKVVPEFCYLANEDFVKGLLDGYLSGDGTISKNTFSYTTISEDLGNGIALLLKRFGIHTKITSRDDKRKIHYNKVFYFVLKNYNNFKFLSLTCKNKMLKMYNFLYKKEKLLTYFQNNVLEKVIKKEEIESSHKYVYDLTVIGNPNFLHFNSIPLKNTFHYSGVASKSNVNSGVPRIRELISVTKNQATPSLTVYLKNENKTNQDYAKKILNKLEKVNISYFIDETMIYYDPNLMNTNIVEDKDFLIDYYNFYEDIEINKLSPWVLKLKINELHLLNKNISLFDLYSFFLNKYNNDNIHIIFSDENSDNLVFHFRYIYEDINKTIEDELITNNDVDKLKLLENDILSNILNGVDNIDKVTIREINQLKIKQNGSIDNTKKEYVLDTTGSNFEEILKLYNLLDINSTFSNNIHEVYNLLGIEAARQLLKNEINNVMKFSGIYINDKHLNLLTDFMTLKGDLISIDRHGVRLSDSGPLAKSSFEESDEHFIKSTLFNMNDNMKSLTSNLIMGQVGNFGTGICDIEFDFKKFQKILKK